MLFSICILKNQKKQESTSVQIFVVQRISRYFVQSLIGAMILEPLSKKSWFAMNNEEIHSHGMFEQNLNGSCTIDLF
jgi:hypothetical protein